MKLLLLFLLLPIFAISQEKETTKKIIEFAEVDPQFVGGETAMNEFIIENIQYPERAIEMGEQGIVYIQFIVLKTGEITGVKVIKGSTDLLDEEALRVVTMMPNWIPGKQGGEDVNVRFTLPIHFRLGAGKKRKVSLRLLKKEKRALKKQERRNKKRK